MSRPTPNITPYGRKGALVRLAYLAVASAVWLLTAGGRLGRKRTVVLCYHAVTGEQAARFDRQMRAIRGRALPLSDVSSSHATPPSVCVTFDDAFACLLEHAIPALERHAVPATIFPVTGVLGRTPNWDIARDHPEAALPTMTEDELRHAASRAGIAIGSHTVSHPRLSRLDDVSRARELRESRAEIERITDRPAPDLALPHGDSDERVRRASLDAGYERVLTLDPVTEPSGLPEGLVGRFSMSPDAWPIEFRLTVDGAYAWLAPLRRLANSIRGRGKAPAVGAAREAAA